VHGRKVSARAQQICTLRNQFGRSAWKAAFALRKAMSARAVIRRNSGDAPLPEMDNALGFASVACGHVPQRLLARSMTSSARPLRMALTMKPWQNAVASCPRGAGNVERRAIVGQPAPKLFGNDLKVMAIFAERDLSSSSGRRQHRLISEALRSDCCAAMGARH
jgi:hypothetical protein